MPEAIAFAFIAGIDPLVGLYGAFMMGLVTALIGGRPGMISGVTGAMAVVMVHMIKIGNDVGLAYATPIENLGLYWLFITLLTLNTNQCRAIPSGKICSSDSSSRYDGFCQWSRYCDFYFPTRPI